MPNSSLRVQFSASASQVSLDWRINLEQEKIPETSRKAELGDLMPMWNNAINGQSAYEYIYDNCPYATMRDGVLMVTILFFVYPSVITIPYRLRADFGEIYGGVLTSQERSMDVLLSGVDRLQLENVVDGDVALQMPVFNGHGEEIYPEIRLENGIIYSSEPCYTSLRLNGEVSCFAHTLTMQITKTTEGAPGARVGLKITNLVNSITVEWVDENGNLQKTTMGIEIPPCVAAMLEVCEDDIPGGGDIIHGAEDSLRVYYNTCTGEIIKKVVIEGDSDDN